MTSGQSVLRADSVESKLTTSPGAPLLHLRPGVNKALDPVPEMIRLHARVPHHEGQSPPSTNSCTVLRSTPAITRRLANVCRQVCHVTPSRPVASIPFARRATCARSTASERNFEASREPQMEPRPRRGFSHRSAEGPRRNLPGAGRHRRGVLPPLPGRLGCPPTPPGRLP